MKVPIVKWYYESTVPTFVLIIVRIRSVPSQGFCSRLQLPVGSVRRPNARLFKMQTVLVATSSFKLLVTPTLSSSIRGSQIKIRPNKF